MPNATAVEDLIAAVDHILNAGNPIHWTPLEVAANRARLEVRSCPLCVHAWRRHDPEDGRCDAASDDPRVFGACPCGRDLHWIQEQIAALSSAVLDAKGESGRA